MGQLVATDGCGGCCLGGKNHRSMVAQKEARDCLGRWEGRGLRGRGYDLEDVEGLAQQAVETHVRKSA